MKHVEESIIKKANSPWEIFSKDLDLVEQEKEQYLDKYKPVNYKKVENYITQQKVILLYRQALEALGNGGELTLIAKEGDNVDYFQMYENMSPLFELTIGEKRYKFYENVFEGEIAYVFRGTSDKDIVYLKVAIDPADNALISSEYGVLSNVRHESFPQVEHKIKVNDSEAILMKEVKGITMPELMEQYPDGVPAEHVMWMLERLLSEVGYLHANFVVHGNIKPENVIINKENHNVSLVGFSFSIANANSPDARYKIKNEFYTAPEVNKSAKVLPSSDIYSIGMVAISLLGGDVSTGDMPISVDSRVRAFIKRMADKRKTYRPNDAWELWSELIELRTEVFGTERFKKLN